MVLNEFSKETTKTLIRVVEEVCTSTRVVDGASSSKAHPSQELWEPQRSGRVINPPAHYLGLTETQDIIPDNEVEDPLTYNQAMNNVNKDEWIKVIDLEMESTYFNPVWDLEN